MAAPTVRQIRQGLADRLDTIDGLRVFSTIPGQFSPPAGIVSMPWREETETMRRGTDEWRILAWVVVARQADAQSEHLLEEYLDPTGSKSVRAAVRGDTTWGGVINKGSVFEASAEATRLELGDHIWIGLRFEFRFLADGKD